MELTLNRSSEPLRGSVAVPGDKSLAHRAALFAALADGVSEIRNYPDSGVTRAMRGALEALGVCSELDAQGTLRMRGNGWRPFAHAAESVHCGNSGTTFRLLAGALAGTGTSGVRLTGTDRLMARPMDRIWNPLAEMGHPGPLHGIDYTLPVASAQVKSCLILAALGASGETVLREPGPSRDHTERMLRNMGADVRSEAGGVVRVSTLSAPLRPLVGTLPGDISSAAFLLAAASIVPGSRIVVENVGLNETRTGMLDILSAMGATIRIAHCRSEFGEPVGDVNLIAPDRLHGVEIDGDLVVRTIDEFPAVAAVAAFAEGETVVHDAQELRYKESDRIACLVTELVALGADAEECPDGFAIRGGTLKGGRARALKDHRLAMSLALTGLRAPANVVVEGAEILNESFPGFLNALRAVGAAGKES